MAFLEKRRNYQLIGVLFFIFIIAIFVLTHVMTHSANSGNGFYLDGSSYLSLNKTVNGNFTASAWVEYQKFNGTGVILAQGLGENSHSIFYMGSGGEVGSRLSCGVFSDYDLGQNVTAGWRFASSGIPTLGVWHNVVCTFNSSYISLYLDGALLNSTPTPYPIENATLMEIGKRTSTFYINGTIPTFAFFNGDISNIQVYNYSFDSEQVHGIYSKGISGAPKNAGIYLPLTNDSDYACFSFGHVCNLAYHSTS